MNSCIIQSVQNKIIKAIRRNYVNKKLSKLRGFKILKKEKHLSLWRDIITCLNKLPPVENLAISRTVFGVGIANGEEILHQYCNDKLLQGWLNDAILEFLGKKTGSIIHPLPEKWARCIENYGFPINIRFCKLALILKSTCFLLYGIALFIKTVSLSLQSKKKISVLPNSVYFHSLGSSNIPTSKDEYNIITWFLNSPFSAKTKIIYHNVKCNEYEYKSKQVKSLPYDDLWKIDKAYFHNYLLWFILAFFTASRDLIVGKWWNAFIFSEAVKYKTFELSKQNVNIKSHFFHWSGGNYRPLWTYLAEHKGAQIICYFYSSAETPKNGHSASGNPEFGLLNWPQIFVWDEWQKANLIKSGAKAEKFTISGPISFSDSNTKLPLLPNDSIAVFDIQPHRQLLYCPWSTRAEYIALFPNLCFDFLSDILEVLSLKGFHCVHKAKREIGKRCDRRYYHQLTKLMKSSHYISIDPNLSPIKIINRCSGIISMPFTATALYSSTKPSIYYDPTGWIAKDDPAAHGIPIISGKKELAIWLGSLQVQSKGNNNIISIKHVT
jgi:polysaccharide biosynthesis PFTS motif protein